MSIKIEVKAQGLKELRGFMRGFQADIERVNQRSLQRVGLRMEAEAVKHISNQDLGWPANSARYLARKEKAGGSSKVLVDSSTYLQAITSHVDKGRVFVGVDRQAREADGQPVANIAAVLEFGSLARRIPPRPLWSVVLADVAAWVQRERFFAREIINELRRKYGNAGPAGAVEAAVEPPLSGKTAPQTHTGRRGGKFHISASGRRVYHKR